MELGARLRQARLEAGLSQRQLCGDEITRNMLSQIENGSARPTMTTLQYLAARLGKPVGYFLEEEAVLSPNQQVMAGARRAFLAGESQSVLRTLAEYREPDPVFDQEKALLLSLSAMDAAEQALAQGRLPYAAELLRQAGSAGQNCCYYTQALERRRLLLLGQAAPEEAPRVAKLLPSLDEELLLRARAALEAEMPERCGQLLEAARDKTSPLWNLLRGEAYFAQGMFAEAARCYHRAEQAHPREAVPRLESCYRQLEDYKQAYFYACKGREA